MANLNVGQIQMPTLTELPTKNQTKVDQGFKFTLLSQIGEAELQERMEQMVRDIGEQGNKIAEHMDIRDLKMYRSMISTFVSEVVANSHKFSRENFLDRRGRHRVYQKLDELTQELLKSEKKHVDILDRIGEIQGLILDILT